jgi:hypothetical protein
MDLIGRKTQMSKDKNKPQKEYGQTTQRQFLAASGAVAGAAAMVMGPGIANIPRNVTQNAAARLASPLAQHHR